MVIYGIALLGVCTSLGLFAGELLGSLFGIDANVGGIGIAMFLLMCATSFFKGRFEIGNVSEKGITFSHEDRPIIKTKPIILNNFLCIYRIEKTFSCCPANKPKPSVMLLYT